MIKDIFNDKKGRVQKLILIILIALAIFLVPIGIYASENAGDPPLQNPEGEISSETEIIPGPEINETVVDKPVNETQTETNETVVDPMKTELSNETESLGGGGGEDGDQSQIPNIEIEISSPEKITRGEVIEVKANIINIGKTEAKNVVVEWQLPKGFEIISENKKEKINTISPNNSHISEIQVQTSLTTSLGDNEIKISLTY